MAFLNKIGSFIKPLATNLIKNIAPKVTSALKGIAGNVISDIFQKGTGALQGLLGKIPLAGPLLSGLVGKYAPGLENIAKNFVNGGIDKLLSMITGAPTQRPVPGTSANVTTPPLSDPGRAASIVANSPAPQTSSAASTGGSSGAGSTGGASSGMPTYNGSFPSFPKPPTDPKDLAAQNKYQEDMYAFQHAQQTMNTFWTTMQNALKSMGEVAMGAARNLR
ncbi:MAG: hypothetical protein JNJ54_02595 [Myxococcaceae bacterium]|nr:hypothetical protein [Myxococcaceae bacterium]